MAKYRVDISEPAEDDLRDIARYISSQLSVPMTAIKMIEAIEEALSKLSDMPHGYPALRDDRLASMGYRRVDVKNYTAFFTINEKEKVVDVERILYARRDWANLL
ncbi:MAG: type II toxin-antitoxin system RelE/ParE family toxin [Clostridiales bacterium]|nr:type II toxin-antitoxin system RelE/ParE family toxin [Clostridiales bacterium]